MAMTAAEKQAAYRQRQKQGIEIYHKRVINDEGRECAYSGPGNCGHAFKLWDEYSPGAGPRGKERRCKPCMVAKMTDYLIRQPDPLKQKRNARQAKYQQTPIGRDVNRRAKLKYRYGITPEQYDQMLEAQQGLCYFCGLLETVIHHGNGKVMQLGVDHDHGCGCGHDPKKACEHCVRGLSCYNCNIYIARIEKSPVLLPLLKDLLDRRPLL